MTEWPKEQIAVLSPTLRGSIRCVISQEKYFIYDKGLRARVHGVPQMLNGLLSTAEVARKLGVTRQRVLEFIKTDRLRAKKVGRSYVVHSKDVLSLSRFKVGRPSRANGPAREKIQKTKLTKRLIEP